MSRLVNSKERFLSVCGHKLPDRFPIDYLADQETDRRLRRFFDVESEDELLEVLECDFYYLPFRDISQNESFLPFYKGPELERTETERLCPFGIRYMRMAFDSKFAVDEAIQGPLENAVSSTDILKHRWPDMDCFDLEPLHAECEEHKDKIIIGGMWSGILGDCYRMLGFQNFLTNMAMNPPMIRTLVDRMTEFYLELNERVFSILKGKIDVWFWGNDYATQDGLLFSMTMFEDYFLKNIKHLTELAKSYGLKIMEHTCGAVSEILPLLIEAGVDIIDPVQVSAKGMEPTVLKEKYGKDIVFHGGIDTQHVLPHLQPLEVYDHACDIMSTLGSNGGYIFAPSQILQSDIPVENIAAMYRAAKDFNPDGRMKGNLDE
jgi:uroporphyrinogen decarboxylase